MSVDTAAGGTVAPLSVDWTHPLGALDSLAAGHPVSLVLIGGILTLMARAALRGLGTTPTLGVVGFGFGVLLLGSVADAEVDPARAAMLLLCGGSALVAIRQMILRISQGDGFAIHEVGGFGGESGGWRLTPTTTLALIAGTLLGVALLMLPPPRQVAKPDAANATATAGQTGR